VEELMFAAFLAVALAGSTTDLANAEELQALRALEERVERLEQRSLEVSARFEDAASGSGDATMLFLSARDALSSAAGTERRSASLAEVVTVELFVATALMAGLHGPDAVCANEMSTHAYRLRYGVRPGYDVDHILPHRWFGADNRLNYQVLPEAQNRSLGSSIFGKDPFSLAIGAAVSLLASACP
jgi:hypothetical protein